MSRVPERPAAPAAREEPVVVDLTLVDAMLALTPAERLRANDRMIRTVEELRHGFAVARTRDAAGPAGGERD
jgi:hypothetical protein